MHGLAPSVPCSAPNMHNQAPVLLDLTPTGDCITHHCAVSCSPLDAGYIITEAMHEHQDLHQQSNC